MFDSSRAIAVYRGWDELEKQRSEGDQATVIDFDLVPQLPDVEPFNTRAEVLQALCELRASVDNVDDTTEFICAKLNASIHYLQELERPGQPTEFYRHVRNILGISPELVSLETIGYHRQRVNQHLLSEFKIPIVDGRPSEAEFQAFDESISIKQDDALAQAKQAEDKYLPQVLDLLGLSGLNLTRRTEAVQVEAYWRAWTSGEIGDLLLRYNFHPINRWRQGDMEYLTLHEVCGHFVHAASMAKEIEGGDLDPFIGITTVHDPHGFMGEAIADALTYFFPEELRLSPHGLLVRETSSLRDFLNNNAHILVNMGWDKQLLLKDLLTDLFTPEEKARLNLERWPTNPLWRAYQYSYGIARKYHQDLATRMTREQKIRYLQWAFKRYVTPSRLLQYAEGVIASG